MLYKMNLDDEPFQMIKNGLKTIEMRLNYKGRGEIASGDEILFTDNSSKEEMKCLVLNNYKYKNFIELYQNHNKTTIGYLEDEDASPIDMLKYYKNDDIIKYGVLAIEVKVIKE